MTGAVGLSPAQSLLAVWGIAWRSLTNKAPIYSQNLSVQLHIELCVCNEPEVFDESTAGSKAADTEREKNPASGVRRLGWILGQLLANLTVDLIPF